MEKDTRVKQHLRQGKPVRGYVQKRKQAEEDIYSNSSLARNAASGALLVGLAVAQAHSVGAHKGIRNAVQGFINKRHKALARYSPVDAALNSSLGAIRNSSLDKRLERFPALKIMKEAEQLQGFERVTGKVRQEIIDLEKAFRKSQRYLSNTKRAEVISALNTKVAELDNVVFTEFTKLSPEVRQTLLDIEYSAMLQEAGGNHRALFESQKVNVSTAGSVYRGYASQNKVDVPTQQELEKYQSVLKKIKESPYAHERETFSKKLEVIGNRLFGKYDKARNDLTRLGFTERELQLLGLSRMNPTASTFVDMSYGNGLATFAKSDVRSHTRKGKVVKAHKRSRKEQKLREHIGLGIGVAALGALGYTKLSRLRHVLQANKIVPPHERINPFLDFIGIHFRKPKKFDADEFNQTLYKVTNLENSPTKSVDTLIASMPSISSKPKGRLTKAERSALLRDMHDINVPVGQKIPLMSVPGSKEYKEAARTYYGIKKRERTRLNKTPGDFLRRLRDAVDNRGSFIDSSTDMKNLGASMNRFGTYGGRASTVPENYRELRKKLYGFSRATTTLADFSINHLKAMPLSTLADFSNS